MNTSRDIEKLFDHFGGNAGDYQEIGRENEAKSARTRWPLLATLDFAQPAIPEIAPRRDSQPSAFGTAGSEPAAEPAARPTPIHRGRPQLFTRPHRRTIPPVDAPAAQSLSALRFSALADPAAIETATETAPDMAPAAAPTPAPAEPRPAAATFGSSVLARRAPAAAALTPAAPPRVQPAAEAEAEAPSILGKLFKPQTPPAPSAPANSLQSMFDRLRHTGESANTQPAAHRTSRLSRS
ncbi:cellulose biosynthesis protein BcsP [Caballeronia sp. LZ034LL]|uniref:cellulose biosynthesis protein BcsP n=1 Tax=Caballeronia sp. LZ034LL TaxID=3038567 RepID=UPI0028599E81|nr:cellulose biosynthesis protein BcsP [Caballeronia sp. LZ034LL]MDR5838471.1 cellulose biosynthesis protein BcsP [Caballeronia sp. LZ034LL]